MAVGEAVEVLERAGFMRLENETATQHLDRASDVLMGSGLVTLDIAVEAMTTFMRGGKVERTPAVRQFIRRLRSAVAAVTQDQAVPILEVDTSELLESETFGDDPVAKDSLIIIEPTETIESSVPIAANNIDRPISIEGRMQSVFMKLGIEAGEADDKDSILEAIFSGVGLYCQVIAEARPQALETTHALEDALLDYVSGVSLFALGQENGLSQHEMRTRLYDFITEIANTFNDSGLLDHIKRGERFKDLPLQEAMAIKDALVEKVSEKPARSQGKVAISNTFAKTQDTPKELLLEPHITRSRRILMDLGVEEAVIDTGDAVKQRQAADFIFEVYQRVMGTYGVASRGEERLSARLELVRAQLDGNPKLALKVAEQLGITLADASTTCRLFVAEVGQLLEGTDGRRLAKKIIFGKQVHPGEHAILVKQLGQKIRPIPSSATESGVDMQGFRAAVGINNTEDGGGETIWQERALCAQTDPEAFFPEKGGSTREAKQICLSCDVRGECLEAALDNDERFGIWGGLSERERRKLKKRPRDSLLPYVA